MIHLNVKFNEHIEAWLQDVTDGKDEMKFMFSALREVATQWIVPYMRMKTDGYLQIGEKKITPDMLHKEQFKDEEGGELVLGDKMVTNLQNAFSVLKAVNPSVISMDINDWARKVIEEKIVMKKAEMETEDMKKEEEMIKDGK